jgi:flagellar biogenesis protein FliO
MENGGWRIKSSPSSIFHPLSSICSIALLVLLIGASAFGQTTQRSLEDEPLKSTAISAQGTAQNGNTAGTSESLLDYQRVGLALAIVLGAIFLLRWGGRKMFLLHGQAKGHGGIRVLSRSVLSPKQQLLLLKVGKRLIVVGDSAGHMSALCEITDPDEVAGLMGEVNENRSEPAAKSFRKLFGLAKEPFEQTMADQVVEEEPNIVAPTDDMVSTHDEIGGLLEKVRLMRQQFRRT